MGKRIVIVVTLLTLAFLFWLPGRELRILADAVLPAAEEATEAAYREDWEAAAGILGRMQAIFEDRRKSLLLFLQHNSIQELEVSLQAGVHLARLEEGGQLLMELERIRALLQNLQSQEGLNFHTLF